MYNKELILLSTDRITSDSTVTVPSSAKSMDIFLVGGGGGGGAWYTWGYSGGMPGTGGQCAMYENIKVTPGNTLSITIGAGGSKATSYVALKQSATDGGQTILTYNGTSYVANGGIGGINGWYEGDHTNDSVFSNTWIEFVDTYGTSQWYSGNKYFNGSLVTNWYNSLYNMRYYPKGGSITEVVAANSSPYSNSNPIQIYSFGIPEFFEEGEYTHAAPGTMDSNTRFRTTYGPSGTSVYNSTDDFYFWGSDGYGAGGFGGCYRNSNMRYGGNGTSGIAVIRWYGY